MDGVSGQGKLVSSAPGPQTPERRLLGGASSQQLHDLLSDSQVLCRLRVLLNESGRSCEPERCYAPAAGCVTRSTLTALLSFARAVVSIAPTQTPELECDEGGLGPPGR